MISNNRTQRNIERMTLLSVLLASSGCPSDRTATPDGLQANQPIEARSPNNPRVTQRTARAPMTPRQAPTGPPTFRQELRTIDGTLNNETNPEWGSAGIPFLRRSPASYGEASIPSGADRPNARAISEAVCAEGEPVLNSLGATDFVWQWGQFLDHDIDLTPEVDPAESFDIAVPKGDAWFDPLGTDAVSMHFGRSLYVTRGGVREQLNDITAFIDGSNVYGSDEARASALRALDGTGRLKTSTNDLLPFNTDGVANAAPPGRDPSTMFLAGDFRANEQAGLTVMHTLFVREHNRLATRLRSANPTLTGDEIYERARAFVVGELQSITYRSFLPTLLGPGAIPPYRGYDSSIDPSVTNEFATAAYRFGHSMLSTHILRLNADGTPTDAGPLALADAFFAPNVLTEGHLDSLLRGLSRQTARAIDLAIVDDVRNLLFGPPGAGGLDLASLNIQRGRDHGLPSFGAVRAAYGLEAPESFSDVSVDPATRDALQRVYTSVDQIDPWIGMLAEQPVEPGLVGETARAILVDQFRRLRDGDRFWYETYLPQEVVREIDERTLATIIRDNTGVGAELADDVFRLSDE